MMWSGERNAGDTDAKSPLVSQAGAAAWTTRGGEDGRNGKGRHGGQDPDASGGPAKEIHAGRATRWANGSPTAHDPRAQCASGAHVPEAEADAQSDAGLPPRRPRSRAAAAVGV